MEDYTVFRESESVSLYDYYGKAQGMKRGLEVYGMAVQDCVHIDSQQVNQGGYKGRVRTYPRTWLDKVVFIDLAHQGGAKSDSQIVEDLQNGYVYSGGL